jgi:hypothetical protein
LAILLGARELSFIARPLRPMEVTGVGAALAARLLLISFLRKSLEQ